MEMMSSFSILMNIWSGATFLGLDENSANRMKNVQIDEFNFFFHHELYL